MALEQRSPEEATEPANAAIEALLQRQFDMVDKAIDAHLRPIAIEPDIGGFSGLDFVHKGMESLPKDSKSAFDQYNADSTSDADKKTARAQLENLLPGNWSSTQRQKWFQAMDKARSNGMDLSDLQLPRPVEDGADEIFDRRVQILRNQTWSGVAADYLKTNPDAKLVMFAGAAHFRYGKSDIPLGDIKETTELLQDAGIKSTVLQFAGGDHQRDDENNAEERIRRFLYWSKYPETGITRKSKFIPDTPDSAQFSSTLWTETIRKNLNATTPFALDVSAKDVRQADKIVFLPAI